MLGPNLVRAVVEIDEIAGGDVDRANAETHFAGVDAVEVDEALSVALQGRRIIEAGRPGRSGRLQQRVDHAGREEARRAEQAAAVA